MPSVLLRGPVLTPLPDGRAAAWADGRVEIGADGRLLAVGAWPEAAPDGEPGGAGDADRARADARRAVATGRALILPAFVDAHVHLPQLDIRGRYGLPLLPWLTEIVFPAEAAFSDPEYAARTAERFFTALAGAGIGTAAVFATVHAAATGRAFEAAAASGLRVVLGKVLMDRRAPAALCETAEEGIRASLALAETWDGAAGGRLRYAFTPRFAPGCSAALLAATGAAARATGLRIQTHLAEQADEIALVREDFPESDDYLAVYERAGLVREGAIFAHAIHCDDAAFQRLAAAGASIACCPTSNAFLRSGAFPLARARAAGVTIGVGSDVGGGPQFSPLDVLRHLAYLDRVPPAELLYRATLAGAEALGFAGETGCLAPGHAADLVVLEPPPDAVGNPLERFTQCVFRQPDTRVIATLVEGRVVHGSLPAAPRP